jgi:ABC-type multidrug transport system permease subunit
MSFEERNAVTGIFVSFITWAIMLTVLLQKSAAGMFEGAAGLEHWARSVLWLILVGIGIAIVMTILFNIAYAIITGEKKPDFLSDERDTLIGLRGMQATLIVITSGIICAIAALAIGASVLQALNIILAACALGSFASEVTKLILYRRGV